MSDRYAWLHSPHTQALIAALKGGKKELLEMFSNGVFCGETADTTAMGHTEIIGRCKVINSVLEMIENGVEQEYHENDNTSPEVEPSEEYTDA